MNIPMIIGGVELLIVFLSLIISAFHAADTADFEEAVGMFFSTVFVVNIILGLVGCALYLIIKGLG